MIVRSQFPNASGNFEITALSSTLFKKGMWECGNVGNQIYRETLNKCNIDKSKLPLK